MAPVTRVFLRFCLFLLCHKCRTRILCGNVPDRLRIGLFPAIVNIMQLRDTLRFVALAALFLTPFVALIVAETMFFPFITGKNFAFRILVEIALGAWAILALIDKSYRPRPSVILSAAGLFLAVIAVADFFGENWYRSFWSNYERMEGLITHAHLLLYFVMLGTILRTEHLWTWFIRTSLGASLLIACYGFAQHWGMAEVHQSEFRIDASLGNATYLAIYALMHAGLALFMWAREKEKNPHRWVYLVIAATNIAVMYFTQTRGSLLGLIGGAGIAFLLIALFGVKEEGAQKLRRIAWGGMIAIVLVVGSFVLFKDSLWKPVIDRSYTLQRMSVISLADLTTTSRFTIWKMSWEGFKERPILGWGQDNFIYVFSKYYDPKMWNQEPWFDRSHNVFFDWMIAGGTLGILSYLSLFGSALYVIWTVGRRRLSLLERVILTGTLVGYFIHNIFVFDNLTSYLIFFTILAYLHSVAVSDAGAEDGDRVKNEGKRHRDDWETGDLLIATSVIVVVVGALLYLVNFRNISANRELITAISKAVIPVPNGEPIIPIEAVLEKKLFGRTEAREQLGNLAFQALDPRVDPKLRQRVYTLAEKNLRDEITNDPNNLRYHSFLASLYARYGKYPEAENEFKRGLELSPNRQALLLEYGGTLLTQGRVDDALPVLKKAYDLDALPDGRTFYAIALIYKGQIAEAENVLAPTKGTPQEYDSRIISAWGIARRFDKIVALTNEKIAKGEAVGRDYLSLGGALNELGQKAKAREAVLKAIELDPSLKDQGEAFLKGI